QGAAPRRAQEKAKGPAKDPAKEKDRQREGPADRGRGRPAARAAGRRRAAGGRAGSVSRGLRARARAHQEAGAVLMATEAYAGWAIVELFGHVRLAGQVSQVEQYGSTMLRLDVPEVDGHPGFTSFKGGA